MNDPGEINVLSPEHVNNPFPAYQWLRDNDPVHWSDTVQGWLLTRYEDVKNWLNDSRFSANRTHMFAKHQLRGIAPDIVKDYLRLTASMIVMKDGADHDRLRAQEDRALCPAHVDAWTPTVHSIVNELLDRVQSRRKIELVADLSEPLPSLLLTEMFGIPARDREQFQLWAEDATAFFAVTPGDVEETARRANEGLVQLEKYIRAIITERRSKQGRDLVSMFVGAHDRGEITTEELVANSVHMLIVGHMTSIAQFSNGVYELLYHPEALNALRAKPSLWSSAIEETIRFSPAVHFTHRIATEDIDIRGKTVRKGQLAFFGLASANRDARIFPDPDVFDITRPTDRHLSFGSGMHNCVGSGLGRRELTVGYQTLFKRMPELRFDEEDPPVRRASGLTFRGFARLSLRF